MMKEKVRTWSRQEVQRHLSQSTVRFALEQCVPVGERVTYGAVWWRSEVDFKGVIVFRDIVVMHGLKEGMTGLATSCVRSIIVGR